MSKETDLCKIIYEQYNLIILSNAKKFIAEQYETRILRVRGYYRFQRQAQARDPSPARGVRVKCTSLHHGILWHSFYSSGRRGD